MKSYPKWFIAFLWSVIIGVAITGFALVPKSVDLRFAMVLPINFNDETTEVARIAHAVISFVFCILLGALWTTHMRMGWRKKGKLKTGLPLALLGILLTISALFLYYSAEDTVTNIASLLHISCGILFVLFFLMHYLSHRLERNKSKS